MKKLLILSVLSTLLTAQADIVKVRDVEIIITQENDEAKLVVKKGDKSLPVKLRTDFMTATVTKKFAIKDKVVFLISQSTGGNACPAEYFFLTVDKNIQRTPDFGTCSDLDKTKQDGNKIIVTLPNMGKKGNSIYVYEDSIVKENGKDIK